MLGRVIRDLIRPAAPPDAPPSGRHRVLNVGGGTKKIPIPGHYAGWDHLLLDIDAGRNPDIVCDARDLQKLAPAMFDAVYCSHNLEHYYAHDGARVLQGFLHVLKPDGFAEIRVPDIQAVMKRVVQTGMDVGDVLYESGAGPITVRDVLYGYGKEIEESGQDFYAHKTGFSPSLLQQALKRAGFAAIYVLATPEAFEVRGVGFKSQPDAERLRSMNLVPREAP